jgi:hypothetical protein
MTAAVAETGTPQAREEGMLATMRRGIALSPELRPGIGGTIALAFVSMAGRVAVPIAIQQGIDRGIRAAGGPDLGIVVVIVAITLGMLAIATFCGYLMTRRLFTVSETALAALRARTFRHIHDLSMLHQQSERRGSLVSRGLFRALPCGSFAQVDGLSQRIVTQVRGFPRQDAFHQGRLLLGEGRERRFSPGSGCQLGLPLTEKADRGVMRLLRVGQFHGRQGQ